MINIGNTNISAIYVGNQSVSKVYLGSTEIWSVSSGSPVPYEQQYFTIEALSGGTITWAVSGVSYSVNDGAWNEWNSGSTLSVNQGDKVRFKSDTNTSYKSKKISSYGEFKVYGNIMSLLYGDNFTGQTTLTAQECFRALFSSANKLQDAENLILPALEMRKYCYAAMFMNCVSLTKAPALPATNLYNNISIDNGSMCYYGMFQGCTSLEKAPELPATTLSNYCYNQMFKGCSSLNYVKCLATDISPTDCTKEWVSGVQTNSGTFVKSASMNDWTSGNNGIPANWTVINA